MTKKKSVPAENNAAGVTCNNTSVAQIEAYLKEVGRTTCKNLEELKNLKTHYQCSRSLQELSQLFLPQTK